MCRQSLSVVIYLFLTRASWSDLTSPQRLSPPPAAVESTGAPVGGSPHSWWKCRGCSFEETGWFIYGRILWADWIPRVDARFFSPQIAAQERGCRLILGVFTEAQFIWSTLVSQLQWHEGHMAALLKRNQYFFFNMNEAIITVSMTP